MPLHTVTARRAAVAILAALPGVVALAGPTGGTPVHAATTPGFATPTIVDPVNLYGEPDLRQDPAHPNVWYASGPWGTGTQLSIWNRSGDGAHTFQEMHDHPDPVHTGGSVRQPPGGGDTEVAVDHSGKFYGADLGALVTQKALISTDQGGTLQQNSAPRVFQDQNGAGTDRQWFGLWDPPDPIAAHNNSAYKGPFPVNYMVYLQAVGANCSSNCEMVASSVPTPDGNTSQVGLDYGCSADPNDKGSANCPTWPLDADGYVFIDQLTGKVVQAIETSDKSGNYASVAVLTPGATGYMASAVEHRVAALGTAGTNALFPAITEDSDRNAYEVWVQRPSGSTRGPNDWQVYYSWSPAGADSQWDQWSPPIRVSSPPSKTAIMPWVVAGAGGNVDIAWYGTDNLTTNPEDETASSAASWYVYMAQILGANSATPQITQVKAYDRPMHHGSICLSGTGCIQKQGNRNLADFFEITKDTQGAAYIVFNNTANDLIQQAPIVEQPLPEGQIDHKGAEVVEVVRQISGMGLDGTPIDSPTDIGSYSMDDQAGDAHYDPITGPSYDALDLRGVSLKESADSLTFTIQVTDPSKLNALVTAEPPQADDFADYVVRWEYQSTVYFAAVEVPVASGAPATFFDGQAQTVDLCSVSACDPHIMTYPGPTVAPLTSHLASGAIANPAAASGAVSPAVSANTGSITITVPRSDVGSPKQGDRLDSVGAWSMLSLSSFLAPLPNTSAQNDKVPVVVDGACCFTPVTVATTGGTPAPSPSPSSSPAPAAIGLPNTGAGGLRWGGLAVSVALVVMLGAGLGRRRRHM